jgi:hypothetical protein
LKPQKHFQIGRPAFDFSGRVKLFKSSEAMTERPPACGIVIQETFPVSDPFATLTSPPLTANADLLVLFHDEDNHTSHSGAIRRSRVRGL